MEKRLLVTKVLSRGFRAKDLDTGTFVSVKSDYAKPYAILDTILLSVNREWTFKSHPYLSGTVEKSEFIIENIDVPGHEYRAEGLWDPRETYGTDAHRYFADYLAEGLREEYVFDDYSGYGFYAEDEDPVSDAVEAPTGEMRYDILCRLWEDYPECIDALVHIGNSCFESIYELPHALNCYRTAVHIAEKNLPANFDGIFLWEQIENRPYHRALHGLCLTLWKMKEFGRALEIARKMIRLSPVDNLDARILAEKISAGEEWPE